MKTIKILITLGLFLVFAPGYTQVAISDDASPEPDPASILDLQSSTKGFLTPRMTETEKDAISNPPTGLIIYQTDGTSGFYYNMGTPASPQWGKFTDNTTLPGLWTKTGNDIYYNSGNVGIGNTSPGTDLDVSGSAWFQDSIAVDGSPGRLYINAATNYEPTIRLAYEDATIFKLRYRIGDGTLADPYFMLNSNIHQNIWGVTSWGRVRQDYKGDNQAHLIYSSAAYSTLFIDNDNALAGARGINVTISNGSASSSSVGIAAYNDGDGNAIFGQNGGGAGNFGYLGTASQGAYGENANTYYGALGTTTSGVYGRLGEGVITLVDGDYAVKGIGVESIESNGSDYDYNSTMGGVMGINPAGTEFTFGVAGYTQTANANSSGGVIGSLSDGSVWGSLAYRPSSGSTRYGGYFTSTTTGIGKSVINTMVNIGISAWGDLMGADIHGNVYGLYAEGVDYGIYAHGDVYRTGADIHIQPNAGGENSVMYTLVSTEMVVQTYGIGQLQKGKSSITFDQAFAEVLSAEEPIIVTITPIGKSNGVYLDKVDENGFSVGENNHGKSNVQFSWIAIGKRKGFENKILPEDVIASDYNEKIQRGLVDDNNAYASGEGLYYKDGKLYNGQTNEPRTGNSNIIVEPSLKKEPSEAEVAESIEEDINNN